MAKKAQLDAVRPALEAADETLDKVEKILDKVDKGADVATDVVENGLEKVADVVPDSVDTAVHTGTKGLRKVVTYFRDPKHAAVGIIVLSTTAGAALGVAGYFALKKRLELQFETKYRGEMEARLEEESESLRRFYAKRNKAAGFSTPEEAVESLLPPEAAEALKNYGADNITVSADQQTIEEVAPDDKPSAEDLALLRQRMRSGPPVEIKEDSTRNIFVEGRPLEDFDYEAELLNRSPDQPYVITHDEFMENEDDYEQNSLVYYNGDDTLADENDMPIPDMGPIVGDDAVTKFGYGSKDRNVVYVRNEAIKTDFEITLHEGKFGEEVAGLKHSAPPLRRFRRGDDE